MSPVGLQDPLIYDTGSSCKLAAPAAGIDDSGYISTGGGPAICIGPGSIRSVAGKVGSVIAETLAGKGNLTSNAKLGADQLLEAGERFLGPGYKEIGNPVAASFEARMERVSFGSTAAH